jgi:hypothetical protein
VPWLLFSVSYSYTQSVGLHGRGISQSQGIPRRMCICNIKLSVRETGWGGMDWIVLAPDRDQWRALVDTVMNVQVR